MYHSNNSQQLFINQFNQWKKFFLFLFKECVPENVLKKIVMNKIFGSDLISKNSKKLQIIAMQYFLLKKQVLIRLLKVIGIQREFVII